MLKKIIKRQLRGFSGTNYILQNSPYFKGFGEIRLCVFLLLGCAKCNNPYIHKYYYTAKPAGCVNSS